MYGKIFESMYDGTLVEDWKALITFQQMIILSDADGTVDMTPSAISRRTGIPLEFIEDGIKVLELDDPYSRSPELNGRRIDLLDKENRPWGWSIVNHEKYKLLQNTDQRREKERERKRKQRKKEKGPDLAPKCHAQSQSVTEGCNLSSRSRYEDENENEFNQQESFESFWKTYPRKVDKQKSKLAFNRLSKKEQNLAINDSSERFIKTKKNYIPYPSSYLNGKRWEDESTSNEMENEDELDVV